MRYLYTVPTARAVRIEKRLEVNSTMVACLYVFDPHSGGDVIYE